MIRTVTHRNRPAIVDYLNPPQIDAFFLFEEPEPVATPEIDSNGRAVLQLRGEVGWEIRSADLIDVLAELEDADTIEVRLDTPGGNVWDGVAIANDLRMHPANIEIHVIGMAASAGSVIAMGGDSVTMHPASMMMVHNGRATAFGATAEELTSLADLLTKINVNMADLYVSRAGGSRDTWLGIMAGEEWFTAEEAIAIGLADEQLEPEDVEAAFGDNEDEEAAELSAAVHLHRYPMGEGAPHDIDRHIAALQDPVADTSDTADPLETPRLVSNVTPIAPGVSATAPLDFDEFAIAVTQPVPPKFDPVAYAEAVTGTRKASP